MLSGTGSEATRSACVFCGATNRKLSKEHVWPKWLRKLIELGEGPRIQHSRIRSQRGQVVERTDWPAIPIDWQVKAPCKPCNETWMDRLERECRPRLIPMLRNEMVTLDADDQRALAKWVTLKALMAQYGHPPGMQVIPPQSYHRFYRSQALPPGAQIWTGRYDGAGAWPCDYQHLPLYMTPGAGPEPASPNANFAAFTIGYVAFLYFGHELESGPVFTPRSSVSRYWQPIWPTSPMVVWPPAGLIGADGLERLMRSLEV